MGLRPVHWGGGGGGGHRGVVVVVGLNSPNCSTSCETPKGIQCCIPLGISQVVSLLQGMVEKWGGGGGVIGYCHRSCSSWRATSP